MGCTVERWTAKATGSGDERVIVVKGEGECTGGGYQPRLERTNEGIVDDPDVLALRLVIEKPGPDTTVMKPFKVDIEVQGDPATKVRIDTPDGSQGVEVEEE